MKPEAEVIYIYDGTFEGFLTCVFEAFSEREYPALISKRGEVQLSLGAELKEIETNPASADRVYNGVREKLGAWTLLRLYHSTLSAEEDAEAAALTYLRLGFKAGPKVYNDLANPTVWRLEKIVKGVEREAGQYLQFIRFSELEGNLLFAEFEPEPNVLPLIMPHFSDRLNSQPFIIHDRGRRIAGVYDTREWSLVSSETMELPAVSENEREYRALWKLFFNTIAIKERVNPKLQMQHMPKKYWKHIMEMK